MNSRLIRYIKGYVAVTVTGPSFEQLINRLVQSKIPVWDIRRNGTERGEFEIALPDYFRLKPLLRETSCRVRATGRFGFPFFLDKLGRRKGFVFGAALFLLGIFILSQVVWSVEVTGNETIPKQQILLEAAEEGIRPLQWKFRLRELGALADRLTSEIPNAAWVGVEMQGTKVTIRVVEAVLPEKRTPQSPRHIVSNSDAVVTRIIANRGVPLVDVHTRVKRGDILISGILGDGENREIVVADGEVRGLVWYEYKVQAPINRQHEALTGNARSSFHLVLGGRALQLTGYWQKSYDTERAEADRKQLKFGPWPLPIGWMTVKHQETALVEEKRTAAEARETGLANARADLIGKLGSDTVIREEKILHERLDNGKVVLHILFEAEADLAMERAIAEEEAAPPGTQEGRP